jgi:hypothetical protein
MTEYMLLLPTSEADWAAATPAQRQAVHAAHTEFARLLEARGHKITGGAALTPSADARVVRGDLDDVTVTDGPYAESVEQVSGFYTVATDDFDDLVKTCGVLTATGLHDVVEVRPFLELDMG